jgi:hypothetical protein
MATRSGPPLTRKPVTPGMIVISVVALVVLLGWMAYKNFSHQDVALSPTVEANNAWLTEKSKETGGDASKLSPADRDKLFKVAGPMGAAILRGYGGNRGNSAR